MQDHTAWLPVIYGARQYYPAVQNVGGVDTREGRLLTFPNTLQHRVNPFELADPTAPGHRKIVALFLVDPNVKITSTANVPCQRQDWWWAATQPAHAGVGQLSLPRELQDLVLEEVDFPISLRGAKELRKELMQERKKVQANQIDSLAVEYSVNLCEH